MYFCKLFYASHTAILLIFLFLLCQLKWLLSYMFYCFLQVGMSSRSKVLTWVTWKLFQQFTQVTPFRWSAVSPALCGKPNLCQVHSLIPGFLRIEEIGVWESSNIQGSFYSHVFGVVALPLEIVQCWQSWVFPMILIPFPRVPNLCWKHKLSLPLRVSWIYPPPSNSHTWRIIGIPY